MMKDWNTPIYAFFKPLPQVVVKNGCRTHEFLCFGRGCKATVRWFLDTTDCRSTSNLRKHAKSCWGNDVVRAADDAKNADEVWTKIVPNYLQDGSITAAFERKGKGNIMYSHCQHTRQETK
ncbi:hypothetical protein SCLCIDRAFT_137784 [Scleroderma citrinum Foug A]|uniref:Uncharacterized protein n=1 Tax=Scleroderma citrinum Foug A TaxID=1036808 RepID=A0A0C3CZG5_9AGAM|nr:hypothetical protein SCLCIDRAFT_137784 [Scleroderma citrinum Foug A]